MMSEQPTGHGGHGDSRGRAGRGGLSRRPAADPQGVRGEPQAGSRDGLAERLGFAAGERIAVIHCDDIGLCPAANEGSFDALERGIATAGSLMAPCPAFPAAADTVRHHPHELDLGVHLTLNCEFPHYRWGPVAPAHRVPSLLDGDGGFLPESAQTLARARPEEVEIELRAQIERVRSAGIDITHLDAHMGTVLIPPFVDIYIRLAREYRVAVFAARPPSEVLRSRGLEAVAAQLLAACDALDAAGIPVLDGFDSDSLSFAPGAGALHNRRRLAALPPGVHYFIIHPARDGAELHDVTGPTAHARASEHRFYAGAAGHAALRAEGIHTVGMGALRELIPPGRGSELDGTEGRPPTTGRPHQAHP